MTDVQTPAVRKAGAKYRRIIGPIRETARRLGYAVAVHGSLARDIDLLACPWTDEAVHPQELVASVMEAIREHNSGVGFILEGIDAVEILRGHPKPHGRRAWSIQLGGTYVDLSVMPLLRHE